MADDKRRREAVCRLAALATRSHTECDDEWYSCPKSPGGTGNDLAGDECNCGADGHNAEVAELAALLMQDAGPAAVAVSVGRTAAEVEAEWRAAIVPVLRSRPSPTSDSAPLPEPQAPQ